jgi:hypothetical protein
VYIIILQSVFVIECIVWAGNRNLNLLHGGIPMLRDMFCMERREINVLLCGDGK